MEYRIKRISTAGIAEAIREGGTLSFAQRTGRGRVDLSRYPDNRTAASARIALTWARPYGSVHRPWVRSLPGS